MTAEESSTQQQQQQQQQEGLPLRQQQRSTYNSTMRRYTESDESGNMITFPYYFYQRPALTRRTRPFLSSWRRFRDDDESAAAAAAATTISATTDGTLSPVQQEDDEIILQLDEASPNNSSYMGDDIDVTHHHHHSHPSYYYYYTTESLLQLLRAIRAHDPNVQRIYFNGKQQQQQESHHQHRQQCRFFPVNYLTALLQALQGNRYVTHLTLSHAISPKEDASTIVAALRTYLQSRNHTHNLIHLDLSRNHLQAADMQQIFSSLSTTSSSTSLSSWHLRKLNLEGNALGDVGVQALCTALSSSSTTTTTTTTTTTKLQVSILKLGRNQVTAVGLQAIVNLLVSQGQQGQKRNSNTNVSSSCHHNNTNNENNHCHIRSLDLRGNHLGAAAGLLANVLCRDDCLLESLSLRNNDLDNAVVTRLAQALETNVHLKTLDLQYNAAIDCGASFCRALKVNHTFTKLKLRNTSVNDVWKNELLEALLINTHGPKLAQQTKSALDQVVALQQQKQHTREKWSGNLQLKQEHQDDTEGTDLMSDEDEEGKGDNKKWMESWRIAVQSKTLTKHKQPKQQKSPPECVICCSPMHETAVLLPCTHHNCCSDCGRRLRDCHMCRQVVVKVWPLHVSEGTDANKNVDGLLFDTTQARQLTAD